MPLYSIENVGEWAEGGFTGALVIAPGERRARAVVAHLTRDMDPRDLRVTKVPTSGEWLLSAQFND